MAVLIPDWPTPDNIHTAISTRSGGQSAPPWNSLNLGDRRLPDIPSYFKEDVADILEYVNSKLDQESHLPRGDYKELLELVKPILGGAGRYRAEEGLQLHHTTPWC